MEDFVKEYLSVIKLEKNLSDNSVDSYDTDLFKFLTFVEEKKKYMIGMMYLPI